MSAAPRGRVERLDWPSVSAGLNDLGSTLAGLYDDEARFRSTIDMARHRFGDGECRYFAHPLPDVVAELRAAFWPHLLPIARDWADRLGLPAPWPDDLDDWLAACHDAGQTRPTPLMLRYKAR
jgi:hypothetical protein